VSCLIHLDMSTWHLCATYWLSSITAGELGEENGDSASNPRGWDLRHQQIASNNMQKRRSVVFQCQRSSSSSLTAAMRCSSRQPASSFVCPMQNSRYLLVQRKRTSSCRGIVLDTNIPACTFCYSFNLTWVSFFSDNGSGALPCCLRDVNCRMQHCWSTNQRRLEHQGLDATT
jgi:hypothetical protein